MELDHRRPRTIPAPVNVSAVRETGWCGKGGGGGGGGEGGEGEEEEDGGGGGGEKGNRGHERRVTKVIDYFSDEYEWNS